MSDQKLRDLERRWKEMGSVEDEAAYLLERVRVGELSHERLEELAAWGHRAARVATDNAQLQASEIVDILLQPGNTAPLMGLVLCVARTAIRKADIGAYELEVALTEAAALVVEPTDSRCVIARRAISSADKLTIRLVDGWDTTGGAHDDEAATRTQGVMEALNLATWWFECLARESEVDSAELRERLDSVLALLSMSELSELERLTYSAQPSFESMLTRLRGKSE